MTGDPGKMVAVQRNLSKFGIREIARTGKVGINAEVTLMQYFSHPFFYWIILQACMLL